MKIALLMENSQAAKNELVYNELKGVAEPLGHVVHNYGQFSAEASHSLTYVQLGLLASVLLESGAADFVVTGCGTGEGATLACNAFAGVECGHVETPLDAYLFSQVNGGNAIALPFAQNFGWGGELNLRYIFEKLLLDPIGGGYPVERKVPEQRNAKILKQLKTATNTKLIDVLANLNEVVSKTEGVEPEFVENFVEKTLDYKEFKELFFANAQCEEIKTVVEKLIGR